MESYKVELRKNQWVELKNILLCAISIRTQMQTLHYSDLFLLHQAMKKYVTKVERLQNTFKPDNNKLKKLSFLPHEAMALIQVIVWVEHIGSQYSQVTIREFVTQIDDQSNDLHDFMVGKFYKHENQNDMLQNVKKGILVWD
jgi:hypothetical protein